MRERGHLLMRLGLVVLLAALIALAAAPAFSAPPTGKHFAVVLILVDPETGQIDAAPGCLSFTKSELCTEFGDCGTWEFVTKKGHQNEWKGAMDFVSDGVVIKADFRGITERVGPGDSIAGTMIATLGNVQVNAAFAGTKVTKTACLEFGLQDD